MIIKIFDTKLGKMVAGVTDKGLGMLEFNDPERISKTTHKLQKKYNFKLIEGEDPLLDQVEKELTKYLDGSLNKFTVLLNMIGTEFEKKVWTELLKIPYGTAKSYLEIAKSINHPTGFRAVARANGANNVAIIIPCHRVIASNGNLQGYGGGLWRKEKLLKLEKFGDLENKDIRNMKMGQIISTNV